MTRTANSRIAGVAFIAYIAFGITSMIIDPAGGEDVAARLAQMAAHEGTLRLQLVLGLLMAFCAIVLAVTLYSLTRAVDRDIALFGMSCRLAEGVVGGAAILPAAGMLWLATSGAAGADAAAPHTLAGFIRAADRATPIVAATFFAAGSTAFTWLLARGRLVPAALAWLGVAASLLLVTLLPLALGGVAGGTLTTVMWLPMLVFELRLALWLLVRGVREPSLG